MSPGCHYSLVKKRRGNAGQALPLHLQGSGLKKCRRAKFEVRGYGGKGQDGTGSRLMSLFNKEPFPHLRRIIQA